MSVQTLERVSLVRESEKERLTLDPDVLAGLLDSWKARGNSIEWWYFGHRNVFVDFLLPRVQNVVELDWCTECSSPLVTSDDKVYAGEEGYYCGSCAENASRCNDCGIIPGGDYYSIDAGDYIVCVGCYELGNYSYCDECDIDYHGDDSYEHTHDGSNCCDPVRTEFSIRNDGVGPLRNDTRVEVTLPAGTVDLEGINRIRRYLTARAYDLRDREYSRVLRETGDWRAANRAIVGMPEVDALFMAAELVGNMDPRWQLKDGNFPKRLSRALYKATTNHLKLPAEVMSEIGNIARQHTGDVATYRVEVTRQLNMRAADFYHEDSCWWGSYYHSRCALKSNGGFGMRTFDTYYGDVAGRAWVMPLKATEDGRLVPTFETMTPDAFIVFNSYGELSGYTATRIVAHMSGWTYRKINFKCDPMFINENKGYLVAPEDIAAKYAETGLYFCVSQHSTLHTEERTNA